ncbi:MAG: hypothetical protein AB7F64_06590 [Gammaproteobacteria bacterium]
MILSSFSVIYDYVFGFTASDVFRSERFEEDFFPIIYCLLQGKLSATNFTEARADKIKTSLMYLLWTIDGYHPAGNVSSAHSANQKRVFSDHPAEALRLTGDLIALFSEYVDHFAYSIISLSSLNPEVIQQIRYWEQKISKVQDVIKLINIISSEEAFSNPSDPYRYRGIIDGVPVQYALNPEFTKTHLAAFRFGLPIKIIMDLSEATLKIILEDQDSQTNPVNLSAMDPDFFRGLNPIK